MDKNDNKFTDIDDYINTITKYNLNDEFTLAFNLVREAGKIIYTSNYYNINYNINYNNYNYIILL